MQKGWSRRNLPMKQVLLIADWLQSQYGRMSAFSKARLVPPPLIVLQGLGSESPEILREKNLIVRFAFLSLEAVAMVTAMLICAKVEVDCTYQCNGPRKLIR